MSTKAGISWEDFVAAGEEWQSWECVDGKIDFMSPVNLRHQAIVARLIAYLVRYCEGHPEWLWFPGEATFTMASGNWRCPDAALVRADHFPDKKIPATPAGFPPDVAFEVLSPGESVSQIQRKRQDYQESGVVQVWIDAERRRAELIQPDRPLQYFDESQPLAIDKLAGFALDLKNLFAV